MSNTSIMTKMNDVLPDEWRVEFSHFFSIYMTYAYNRWKKIYIYNISHNYNIHDADMTYIWRVCECIGNIYGIYYRIYKIGCDVGKIIIAGATITRKYK